MPIATQSQFYAFIFIPDCLKPFFAFIANAASEHKLIRGRSRALLLQVCGIGAGAFFVFFAINIFNSCAELMLGAYLMETAHNDLKNVGAVQAVAGGTRSLGSIVAATLNLFLYPCNTSKGVPDSRTLLAYCGIIAVANFALAFLLPDATSELLLPAPPAPTKHKVIEYEEEELDSTSEGVEQENRLATCLIEPYDLDSNHSNQVFHEQNKEKEEEDKEEDSKCTQVHNKNHNILIIENKDIDI
eukprot:CAMPEP_0114335294 /NCGR_PEP_ID=MMETSP0101-20121206/4967_1 /TAXON_ID=38822 ORGANISM="Pteridomonas danica, Strain PT" /NCGR_SAMPLE_ID=MMETSP0101 /ASSEMBLY_ACC=CAM_ASM_000211 /LENGTH=243 /DNA_ID=CAMNT_0001466881 /DNA_START=146 /DNA_END=874 /DNA_ORIENTATION=+